MQITKTLHPPGGATAFIGWQQVRGIGYPFVPTPVLSGSLILLVVALIFNNITTQRRYSTDRRITHRAAIHAQSQALGYTERQL